MDYTDVKAFFVAQATTNGWGLAHNSEHLTEKAGSEKDWVDKLILTMDEPRGGIGYNGNFFDRPTYGFWLLKKVNKGKWEEEDTVYDEAKTAMFTVLSAMNTQMQDETDGIWQHWDPETVNYRKAGPLTKERLFGVYCSFGVKDRLSL